VEVRECMVDVRGGGLRGISPDYDYDGPAITWLVTDLATEVVRSISYEGKGLVSVYHPFFPRVWLRQACAVPAGVVGFGAISTDDGWRISFVAQATVNGIISTAWIQPCATKRFHCGPGMWAVTGASGNPWHGRRWFWTPARSFGDWMATDQPMSLWPSWGDLPLEIFRNCSQWETTGWVISFWPGPRKQRERLRLRWYGLGRAAGLLRPSAGIIFPANDKLPLYPSGWGRAGRARVEIPWPSGT